MADVALFQRLIVDVAFGGEVTPLLSSISPGNLDPGRWGKRVVVLEDQMLAEIDVPPGELEDLRAVE